jgi:hypothetical protein
MHNFSKNGLSGQYSVFKNSLLALSRSPARAFHRYYIHITHRTVCPISSAFDPGQWSGLALQFRNDTALDTDRLTALIIRHTAPYPHLGLQVTIRDSRKAPFSGTCFYLEGRIFVNIGRHNRYPYRFATLLAKAQSANGRWWREAYFITVADAYQLALFVYLHELFHYLVKLAGRSPKRKEGMCDRFAAGVLVDQYQCPITRGDGSPAPRENWDFQDLHRFVAKARQSLTQRVIPVRILG